MENAFAGVEMIIWDNFSFFFFQKDIIHLTHCKSSTYNDGQELRIGDPEYSDIRKWEVPKFSAGMCRANLGCEGGVSNDDCLPVLRGEMFGGQKNRDDANEKNPRV